MLFRRSENNDLEQWKRDNGYDTSYEDEQKAERKKEIIRNIATVGLVGTLVIALAFAVNKKSETVKAEPEKAVVAQVEERNEEPTRVTPKTEVKTDNPSPTPNPGPTPTPDRPNPDPVPPTPNPEPYNSAKDPGYDPENTHSSNASYHDDFRDDPMYSGNAEVGGGRNTMSVEQAERQLRYAEAEVIKAKIDLFEAEHPVMTDAEYEEYGELVKEYGEKTAEILGIDSDLPSPSPNPNTDPGPISPDPEKPHNSASNQDPQPTPHP